MSLYAIGSGWDVPLVSLTTFNPMCQSEGVKATRRDVANDGSVYEWGLYVELLWPLLPLAKFTTVMTTCGLLTTLFNSVTIYCRDDLYVYRRYNGIAVRPATSWQNYFARNVVVLVRDLVLVT